MQNGPAIAAEWVIVAFVAIFGLLIIYQVLRGKIDLSGLLSELTSPTPASPPGLPAPTTPSKASLSRLQLLLFTFIVVGLYLTLSLEAGALVDIPNQVLGLLGISSGSYIVSKGISANS